MPALTRKEVEDIALLARLHLEEAELARMQDELGAILEHFGAIAAAETEGVPPMTHALAEAPSLREDEVLPSLPPEDSLANAPAREGTFFLVPRIIE